MNTQLLQLHTTSVAFAMEMSRRQLNIKSDRWRSICAVTSLFFHELEETRFPIHFDRTVEEVVGFLVELSDAVLDEIADDMRFHLPLANHVLGIVDSLNGKRVVHGDDGCFHERVEIAVPCILKYRTEELREKAFRSATDTVRGGLGVRSEWSSDGYGVKYPKA